MNASTAQITLEDWKTNPMPNLMEDQMAARIVAVRSISINGPPNQTEYKNCFGTIIK